jgi:hypothetical protein
VIALGPPNVSRQLYTRVGTRAINDHARSHFITSVRFRLRNKTGMVLGR